MEHIETNEDRFSFEASLKKLKDILENEHRALIEGDAKQVASLASEKEQVAEALKTARRALPETSSLSSEVAALAKAVEELARLNHTLLQQMYQHYNGMVELFLRLAGQSQTYGKDGTLTIAPSTLRDTQILA